LFVNINNKKEDMLVFFIL